MEPRKGCPGLHDMPAVPDLLELEPDSTPSKNTKGEEGEQNRGSCISPGQTQICQAPDLEPLTAYLPSTTWRKGC